MWYGGEYEGDNTTVKLHSQRGTDRGVTIRYGKNLTDLTQEESCAEVYTGVYPYWVDSDGNVTQITGNPVVNVPDGQYNFVRVLTLDVSQDIKAAHRRAATAGRAGLYRRKQSGRAEGKPDIELCPAGTDRRICRQGPAGAGVPV